MGVRAGRQRGTEVRRLEGEEGGRDERRLSKAAWTAARESAADVLLHAG